MALPPIRIGLGPYTPTRSNLVHQRQAERRGHQFYRWFITLAENPAVKCTGCNGILIINPDGTASGSVVRSMRPCPDDHRP